MSQLPEGYETATPRNVFKQESDWQQSNVSVKLLEEQVIKLQTKVRERIIQNLAHYPFACMEGETIFKNSSPGQTHILQNIDKPPVFSKSLSIGIENMFKLCLLVNASILLI